jgi:ABC-2 type transport system ATP-binding protein
MPNVLELAGVRKIFRDFWGRPRVCALLDVDLAVAKGEIFALLGRNGAGKSTLMQVCLGLLTPTSGRAAVLGGAPGDAAVRRRIGYLPEESYLHGFLTARETLLFHAGLCGLPRDAARARAEHLLGLVELREAAERSVAEFSKGMLRRLCLAQALVGDPELVFLDEPTSGLDPLGTRKVKDLLLQLKGLGRTVFLSSHVLGEVEEVADSVAILERGRIVRAGRMGELLVGADGAPQPLERCFLRAIGAMEEPCGARARS